MPKENEQPTARGALQPIAAEAFMKSSRGARMARHELLSTAYRTASFVAKWTEQNDLVLYSGPLCQCHLRI